MKRAATTVAVLAASLAGACAGPAYTIVDDPFDVAETTTAPEISAIVDVGGGDVTLSGPLAIEASDGVAVIGETLWVRGSSFGKQPTVLVGGRPAAVLGRTREGGLVVRVPAGTPTGSQAVVVSNELGKSERPISVRRYAAVLAPGSGQIGWVVVGVDGPIAAGTTPVPGARWLALSSDGRAGYVAEARGGTIDVIDLPAPGAPEGDLQARAGERGRPGAGAGRGRARAGARRGARQRCRARRYELAAAPGAQRAARVARWRCATPRWRPPIFRPTASCWRSPPRRATRSRCSTSRRPGFTPVANVLAVAPEIRESILCDVAFAPAGDTLWVLSGDTPRSAVVGPEPTQLRAVRLANDSQTLVRMTAARLVEVGDAAAPVRVGVGRALPLASGAAIRLPPERNTVFFAAGAHAGGGTGIFRLDSEDAATVIVASPARVGRPDISPEGRWLLAPAASPDGAVRVLAAAIDGRPAPAGAARPVDAIAALPGEGPPATRPAPELRIQP